MASAAENKTKQLIPLSYSTGTLQADASKHHMQTIH